MSYTDNEFFVHRFCYLPKYNNGKPKVTIVEYPSNKPNRREDSGTAGEI